MRRLVGLAACMGLMNGLVAVLLVRWVAPADDEFGWFSYAPLTDAQSVTVAGRPAWWPAIVAVPLALAAVSAALALVAQRRGWLRCR